MSPEVSNCSVFLPLYFLMTIIYQDKKQKALFALFSVGSLVSETVFFLASYFTVLHNLEISDDKNL